jgi:hypothetical protein
VNRPRRLAQVAGATLLAAVLVLIGASPAAADPPGPTNYRSEVVSVDPDVGIDLRFIGGDSFIELSAGGRDVVVVGYRGEPYLWFRDDGTVLENTRSPSGPLNEDRYGAVALPDTVDPDAEPEWVEVAEGGVHAWHDHRTHWMNPSPPPAARPGDQVLEGVVPLVVDGVEVDVTVSSHLLATPSPIGWLAALVLAAAVAGLAWWRGRTTAVVAVCLLAAAAGSVAGVVAYRSVPAATEPPLTLWLLPVLALASALAAAVLARRDRAGIWAPALLGLAGAELAMWGWTRRLALTRALIPSDLPAVIDRSVVAGAAGIGLVAAAFAVATLLGTTAPGPRTATAREG